MKDGGSLTHFRFSDKKLFVYLRAWDGFFHRVALSVYSIL